MAYIGLVLSLFLKSVDAQNCSQLKTCGKCKQEFDDVTCVWCGGCADSATASAKCHEEDDEDCCVDATSKLECDNVGQLFSCHWCSGKCIKFDPLCVDVPTNGTMATNLVSSTSTSTPATSANNSGILIGATVPSVLLVLVIIGIIVFCVLAARKREAAGKEPHATSTSITDDGRASSVSNSQYSPMPQRSEPSSHYQTPAKHTPYSSMPPNRTAAGEDAGAGEPSNDPTAAGEDGPSNDSTGTQYSRMPTGQGGSDQGSVPAKSEYGSLKLAHAQEERN